MTTMRMSTTAPALRPQDRGQVTFTQSRLRCTAFFHSS